VPEFIYLCFQSAINITISSQFEKQSRIYATQNTYLKGSQTYNIRSKRLTRLHI